MYVGLGPAYVVAPVPWVLILNNLNDLYRLIKAYNAQGTIDDDRQTMTTDRVMCRDADYTRSLSVG